MSHYVDGFIVPVPTRNLDAYKRMAEKLGKLWMEAGALQYWEAVADDVKPGKVTSFPQSVQLKDDEVVVFSWILYKSREDRDRINAKVRCRWAARNRRRRRDRAVLRVDPIDVGAAAARSSPYCPRSRNRCRSWDR